jgi:Deoxyribonuclease II
VVRRAAPAVPLAIALVHAALTSQPVSVPTSPQETQTLKVPVTAQLSGACTTVAGTACPAPYPMVSKGHPVNWWFVFKLNVAKFPACGGGTVSCPFGGDPQDYKPGLQYAFASSEAPALQPGRKDCLGEGSDDPVAATFNEVYNGRFHFVVWNDQFYGDPESASCGGNGCGSPWGHSKGLLAWNDNGDGLVMQVSTPSWPGAGSALSPRRDGNTLGCVDDNNVKVSQHFFALQLTHQDVDAVLDGLANASVVTDASNPQIVSNGGPEDVQEKVRTLGVRSKSTAVQEQILSSGVGMISKSSAMQVPPWQMVSSVLGGIPLRTATWWTNPTIPSTTGGIPACWNASLTTTPGAVQIATSGTWQGVTMGLIGGPKADGNHAKLGVSSDSGDYVVFGDLNQQGALSGKCGSSQNGRGGLFFVLRNSGLANSVRNLLAGETAPS